MVSVSVSLTIGPFVLIFKSSFYISVNSMICSTDSGYKCGQLHAYVSSVVVKVSHVLYSESGREETIQTNGGMVFEGDASEGW